MQLNKLGGELVPSARKIQSVMTEIVEHFKSLGYVPKKGILERTPDADCYVSKYLGQRPYGYEGAADITEHCYKQAGSSTPAQKLHSFRQFDSSKEYCMTQDDFNEKGQVIRHIFDDGEPNKLSSKILTEYEYTGDKVSKEIEYISWNGSDWKEIKTINPETGYWTQETVISDIDRKIDHFNDKRQLIQRTDIRRTLGGDATYTDKKFFELLSGKVKGLEFIEEHNDHKIIRKAEINPETGKITKFSRSADYRNCGQRTYSMFERDDSGRIIHFIDRLGNEGKYNRLDGCYDVITRNGETNNSLFGQSEILDCVDPEVIRIMKEYL